MQVAILTFDGFNELDSLIALGILGRASQSGLRAGLASPTPKVRSMNGVVLEAQMSLDDVANADGVIVGSGLLTRDIVKDAGIMGRLNLDPKRQLIGAQCSGALILAKLGLLRDVPACTDLITKPWVEEAGVSVLNQPFFASGNVATAGGCLASQYLAAWMLARLSGMETARRAILYVAPVGEKEIYLERATQAIGPYLVN